MVPDFRQLGGAAFVASRCCNFVISWKWVKTVQIACFDQLDQFSVVDLASCIYLAASGMTKGVPKAFDGFRYLPNVGSMTGQLS